MAKRRTKTRRHRSRRGAGPFASGVTAVENGIGSILTKGDETLNDASKWALITGKDGVKQIKNLASTTKKEASKLADTTKNLVTDSVSQGAAAAKDGFNNAKNMASRLFGNPKVVSPTGEVVYESSGGRKRRRTKHRKSRKGKKSRRRSRKHRRR